MPLHRDRRTTQQSGKSGPPLRGRPEKPAGLRRGACTGHQPALRPAPRQRTSPVDHGAAIWSQGALVKIFVDVAVSLDQARRDVLFDVCYVGTGEQVCKAWALRKPLLIFLKIQDHQIGLSSLGDDHWPDLRRALHPRSILIKLAAREGRCGHEFILCRIDTTFTVTPSSLASPDGAARRGP